MTVRAPGCCTALLAAVVVLTACGSTVQQEAGMPDALAGPGAGVAVDPLTGEAIDAADGPTPAGPAVTGAAGPAAAAGGATTAAPGPATGTGLPRPAGADAPTAAARPSSEGRLPGRHRAVSDDVVKVGFLYLANAGTVVGAFGVQGYSQGDELGVFRALVADQNERGGVSGRTLEIVPRDLGGIDEASFQAACTFFTQDRPVFMVFTALGHNEILNSCLSKASVGFTSNFVAPPDRLMRGLGSVYAPDDIAAERYAVLLGRSLVKGGFFGKDAKVGIIRQDTPDYERLTTRVLRPILAEAGVEVVAEETFNPNDASGSISQAPAVTFRLRQKGVTHVVTYESPVFYMTAAESQEWRPYWSVTSRSGPGAFLEGSAPKEQLKKASGPGWQPVSDLASSRIKGTINSEEARCLATAKKAGYEYSGAPRYVLQMICGELYHFVRAVAAARELSTAGFQAAAEALAPYPSPMTFSMSFAGGRHDGAAAYRMVAWNGACGCFDYSSATLPMPTS